MPTEQSDRIAEIAKRGQLEPESLTLDEIREVAAAVLCGLFDQGEGLRPSEPHPN